MICYVKGRGARLLFQDKGPVAQALTWEQGAPPARVDIFRPPPRKKLIKKIVSYLKHKQKDLDLFFFFIITFRSAGHKGQVNRLQLCSSSTLCLTI